MMKQIKTLPMILALASLMMSCSMMMVSADTTNNDETTMIQDANRRYVRSLLIRAGRDHRENSQGDRKLDPSLSDFAASLYLYQMDTSSGQPSFEDILSNGAAGQLFYSPSGWDFTFAFVARNLPIGTAYQLVLRYPNNNNSMKCLGSTETVGQVGGLFIRGTVPIEATFSKDDGAKVWLALASDVDCALGTVTPSDYNKYLFPKEDYNLEFDYLGDGL